MALASSLYQRVAADSRYPLGCVKKTKKDGLFGAQSTHLGCLVVNNINALKNLVG
jgi:hypothetical protein